MNLDQSPPYTGGSPYSHTTTFPILRCSPVLRRAPFVLRGTYFGGGRPMNPQATTAFYNYRYGNGIDLHYGDKVCRPTMIGTPGLGDSNIVPETEAKVDPTFSTDEYEMLDM